MSVADRVYARALFDAALEENRLEPVREQLAQIVAAEEEVPELRGELQGIMWLGFALTEAVVFDGLVGGFLGFVLVSG